MLSYPLRPGLYAEFKIKFPGFPMIIVNQSNEIIFGIDFYCSQLAETQNVASPIEYAGEKLQQMKQGCLDDSREIEVLQGDFSDRDGLILGFNLKNRLWGFNLYEKLVFVKRILDHADRAEVYQKTDLDININRELLDKLETIVGEEFKDILIEEKITLKSAVRLCDYSPTDRTELLELFARLPFTSSQQSKILEMTVEILCRDKSSLPEIFNRLDIKKYYDLEMPQQGIIDEIFKYRFPVYTGKESDWNRELKNLKLPDNIKITHYPFFEKKQLELKILLQNPQDLKKVLRKLIP